MNDENYWKQFVKSGRVQDYLAYAKESGQKKEGVSCAGKAHAREGKNVGEYPYAGFYYGNGNGVEPDAYR